MIWGIRKLLGDRRGATAVEYGLILAFIVIAMIATLQVLAGETIGMWNMVTDEVLKKR